MRTPKKTSYDFDENFEVTYEEEISIPYHTDTIGHTTQAKRDTIDFVAPDIGGRSVSSRSRRRNRQNPYDLSIENPDNGYDGYYDEYEEPEYLEDEYENEPYRSTSYRRAPHSRYSEDDYIPSRERSPYPERSRQKGRTPLAAPIKKGGKTIYRISRTLLRNLSLILILAIIGLLTYNFLRGSAPYGDIENAVSSQNYTQMLAAYFVIAAFFLLFELLSALWAMSKVRVRDEFGVYKEDVGRGLFSFVFIYVCSYASFWGSRWIPEIHDVLKGVRGALDVFGSMHNVLFGICAAGVISCLLRKYSLAL